MIELTCPNCGKKFPILPVVSTGHCGCGLDYETKIRGATMYVEWTHDPSFPQSGTRDYSESFSLAP